MAYLFSNHSFSPPQFDNDPSCSNAEDHYESWKYKFIDYWSSRDTLFWLLSELYKLQVQNPATLKLEQFVHTRGCDLKRFSAEDFRKIIPQYGDLLYHQLQMKLRSVADDAWRREMAAYHLQPGPSIGAEHFNMAYFDQPSTSGIAPKQWPPDRRDYDCWAYKRLLEWTPRDTIDCLIHELFQSNINPSKVNLDPFREVFGCDLAKMTLDDFKYMSPEYGALLYRQLQPKIRSNLESELPWNRTYESRDFSHENLSQQPLSYAHRQQLSYAHPSCFRWKSEGIFPGTSTDDSVLNLSRERTSTSVLPGESDPLEGASSGLHLRRQHSTFSRSQSNFSILSMTNNYAGTSDLDIKQEQDEQDPPLETGPCEPTKKVTQDVDSSLSHVKDSDLQESCSVDTILKTEDSQKDSLGSTEDSVYTKETGSNLETSALDHGYNSETNDEMPIDEEEEEVVKVKRRPGRPRSLTKKDKAKGKVGRVWEFIRDLIMDPRYNPSVISWEDREKGLFRFRSGDQVAKLWGCKRGNPRMNFENFSRSIRQNYKKGYLLPVEKIRLVYQFGPRSTGWRAGDPPTRPVTLPPTTTTTTKTKTATTTAAQLG